MSRKLLVADDSVTIQKVIKLALSSEGYSIVAVPDGKEAIKAIQTENPDVVLIDVSLPAGDAYEVKRAINQIPALASIKFVLMYSAFEKVDDAAAAETGFQGRLIKPFDPSNLRKIVGELMNKRDAALPPPLRTAELAIVEEALPPAPIFVEIDGTQDTDLSEGEDLPPVRDMHPIMPSAPLELHPDHDTLELEPHARDDGLTPTPLAPPAAPSTEQVRDLENDIRNLTDSTIRMTGIDAFSWNVDDSRKMKSAGSGTAPARTSTKPTPTAAETPSFVVPMPGKQADDGGNSLLSTLRSQLQQVPTPSQQALQLKPEATTAPSLSQLRQQTMITPPQPAARPAQSTLKSPVLPLSAPQAVSPSATAVPAPTLAQPSAPVITRAEIEALIRKDVEAAIEKMVREVVPQIAENLVKREIDRILSEP